MHRNYPFFDGKILPNSVLSKKNFNHVHQNIDIIFAAFANSSFGIPICTILEVYQCYIVICGLISQFMHVNQFHTWEKSLSWSLARDILEVLLMLSC